MTDTNHPPVTPGPSTSNRSTAQPGRALPGRSVLAALADGIVRAVNATRTTTAQVRLRSRLAVARVQEKSAKARASRALRREARAEADLTTTPKVHRPLPAPLAALITVLLMATSLLTLSTILAVSDVPTVEAWLLPAAFGPVFVLITKLLVSWLLTATQDKPRTTRRLARLLSTALLVGLGAVIAGVAVKSMVIGADDPLDPADAMLSSAAMFGAVILAEGLGAAVLAAVQHAPGAREWDLARHGHARAQARAEKAVTRAFAAEADRARLEELLAGQQEVAAGRGALAHAYAHHKALTVAEHDDPILANHTLEQVHIPAPPPNLLPLRQPVPDLTPHRWDHDEHPEQTRQRYDIDQAGAADIDAEFRRLLAARPDDTPSSTPYSTPDDQDPLW